VPRRNPLSLVLSRTAEHEYTILLTDDECRALVELGLRPTYGLHYSPDLGVEAMLENATSWMQAAEITSAANAGLIPATLCAEIAALLDEAIPEASLDLESTISDRDTWRAGGADRGFFLELGPPETEALYADLIERDERQLQAFRSISAKIELGAY
jgi:hypothetical protein